MKLSTGLVQILLCLAIGLITSCNQSQPPVNRVQPNVVDKSWFEGEWYYLQTVIDTPYSVPYTFVGEQSLLEKVVWEVQDELLIARRAYPWVAGSEGEGITGSADQGAAVAIYTVESHFDIRREYSPTTGEELNVIVENSSDRPWYERQYMRVDWSQNLVTEPEFLTYARIFDGIEAEPVAYYVEDPNHPNAPRFEEDESGEVYYMDVVNKMFVEPTSIYFEGWGELPTCWLEYQTHVDCAPGEVTVRHSFMRVNEERDYQPMDYTGDRMERFGYFVTERAGYDPHYGPVESARHHFINRHNIWQQSHRRDESGALISCESDAECNDGEGSECDLGLATARRTTDGACTIPYRERAVRPIAYHLSEGFPEDMIANANAMATGWNAALNNTVASLRENECLSTGGSAETCAGERSRSESDQLFFLCQNPVPEGAPEACGATGTVARIGDLRYSLLGWVPDAHAGAPLGYGPSAADPETGELVQGNAFIYGAGIEELAAYGRDLVALLNGDLSESDIASGANVQRWAEQTYGREGRGRHVIDLVGTDAPRMNNAMGFDHPPSARRPHAPHRHGHGSDRREARRAAIRQVVADGRLGRDPAISRARVESLRGSPIDAMLTTPDLMAAAGMDPRAPIDDAAMNRASPLRGMSLSRLRALDRARRRLRQARCLMRAGDFTDEGLLGLARAVQQAATTGDGTMEWYGQTYALRLEGGGIDYEAVRRMLRHPIFDSTAAHEVGHTLGLRHNFAGSYDSLNYHPRYWELRNDGDMAPRGWDAITDAEIDGRIREYQYSTVMDYGNNFVVTDAHGLGHYDHAAIKMGYGDLVEVFDRAADPFEVSNVYFYQLYGWPVAMNDDSFYEGNPVTAYPYTTIPAIAGGVARLDERSDVPYRALTAHPDLAEQGIEDPFVDSAGRPAVPYRFCSDEISDLSPDCMLYDAGADPLEVTQSIVDTYWNYYIFSNFRRGRLGFDVPEYWDRVYWRYLSKLQYINQDYAYSRYWVSQFFEDDPTLEEFFTRPDGMGAHTLAVSSAFSLLTRIITAPEPGDYTTFTRANGQDALFQNDYYEPEFTIDPVDGRHLTTQWDFDAGYYWFDQLERVGFFYDKILALMVLVDPETGFLGKDTDSDARGYQINFATTFPDATTSLLRGILAEEWDTIGPRYVDGSLSYPDPVQLAAGDMSGTPIDPHTGFTVQLYGASYSMALMPSTYDDQFLESARIFFLGGAEGVTLPMAEQVRFVDPFTSLTYVAGSYPGPGGEETGVGARMLLEAQTLLDADAYYELDQYLDLVRVMRSLTWELGFTP